MRAYEIHTYRDRVWKVDSVFDDRELAIFEAKRVVEGNRYSGVRVVEENFDEVSNLTKTRTVFRGGAAKSKRSVPADSRSKPKRAGPGGGTGREPARKGGRRPQKKETNVVVPVLVTLVCLLGGLVALLGLNYMSGLK